MEVGEGEMDMHLAVASGRILCSFGEVLLKSRAAASLHLVELQQCLGEASVVER